MRKCLIYQDKNWLWEKYQSGLSFDSIAKLAKCGHTTIAKWFNRFGLKSRPAPCKGKCTKELNPAWKGGRIILKSGYIYRHYSEPHTYRSMGYYVYEHILIMESVLKRKLVKPETVHHLNGNPSDNRPENLLLFPSNKEHRIYEGQLGQFVKQLLWGELSPELKPKLHQLLNTFFSRNG